MQLTYVEDVARATLHGPMVAHRAAIDPYDRGLAIAARRRVRRRDMAPFFNAMVAASPSSSPPSGRSLLQCTTHEGRGERDGWWLSAFAPAELLAAFETILRPGRERGLSGDHRWAEFELPADWGFAARIDGALLQRHTLNEAGYGRTIHRACVTAQPAGDGSALVVAGLDEAGAWETLSRQNPVMLARAFAALHHGEMAAHA